MIEVVAARHVGGVRERHAVEDRVARERRPPRVGARGVERHEHLGVLRLGRRPAAAVPATAGGAARRGEGVFGLLRRREAGRAGRREERDGQHAPMEGLSCHRSFGVTAP